MKASELRIGNWVFDTLDKKECVVEVIDGIYEQVATLDKKMDDYERTIKPEGIPLTEEWLLRFGFEKVSAEISKEQGFQKFYTDGHFSINIDHENHDEMDVWIPNGDNFNVQLLWIHLRSIQYVHQLQNLYFALTEEELLSHRDDH